MKRVCSLLCIFALVLSCLPFAAFAEQEPESADTPSSTLHYYDHRGTDRYTVYSEDGRFGYVELYSKAGKTYVDIDRYCGEETQLVIPSTVDGKIVAGVGLDNKNFSAAPQSIVLEEGIDYLYQLNNLKDVSLTLPDSLTVITEKAISGCSFTHFHVPDGLKALGSDAITNTTFSDTVFHFPEAFELYFTDSMRNTNITEMSFGSEMRMAYPSDDPLYLFGVGFNYYNGRLDFATLEDYIDGKLFGVGSDLQAVHISRDNAFFTSVDGVVYDKTMGYLLCYPDAKPTETFRIPQTVHTVAMSAMSGVTADKVVIAASVEKIDYLGFSHSDIAHIEFEPDSNLQEIDTEAFSYGYQGDLVVPRSVELIADFAFANSDITALSFEQGSHCTSILGAAFSGCEKLKTVVIPPSVTELGFYTKTSNDKLYRKSIKKYVSPHVFEACHSLQSFRLEDNSRLTYMGYNFFSNCNRLKVLDLGQNSMMVDMNSVCWENVETVNLTGCHYLSNIGKSFINSKFTELDLRNTKVTEFVSGSFESNYSLHSVFYPKTMETISDKAFSKISYYYKNELSAVKEQLEAVKSNGIFQYRILDGEAGIVSYLGEEGADVVIPAQLEGCPVTVIATGAFRGKTINSVAFPDTLEIIGESAFENCSLTALGAFPNALTYIGKAAFKSNSDLTGELTLPQGVKALLPDTFSGCSFTSVALPETLVYIGAKALDLPLTELVLPDSISYIEDGGFNTTALRSVTFGAGCNIRRMIRNRFMFHPERMYGVANYDDVMEHMSRYRDCTPNSMEEYRISENCSGYTVVDGVLFNADMTELLYYPHFKADTHYKVPDTVKKIGKRAFDNAWNLKSIELPAALEEIGDFAFYYNDFESIYLPGSLRKVGEAAFGWSKRLQSVTFGEGMNIEILYKTFEYCHQLKHLNFEDDVTIQYVASPFYEAPLEEVDLNCKVYELDEAFYNVKTLKKITLHEGLVRIGHEAFANTAIESITMPSTVKEIGVCAFIQCKALTEVDLGNVRSLAGASFMQCEALESIDLTGVYYLVNTPEGADVKETNTGYNRPFWCINTFALCPKLTKFYFTKEDRTAYIAEEAFSGNETLETVVIGSSVSEIRDSAFSECENLTTAIIAPEVTHIADNAFDGCRHLTIVSTADSPAVRFAVRQNIRYTTLKIAPIPDQTYTGSAILPPLSVSVGEEALSEADYAAQYRDNIAVGTAQVKVTGKGDYRILGAIATFRIVQAQQPEQPEPLKPHAHHYRAKVVAPTYEKGGYTLYTCDCGESFKDQFTPKKTVKATSITKLTKKKKAFMATWKKIGTATGYQLQYSTKKDFSKKKTLTVKSAKKTVKKLKGKKRYYIRVRAYKTVCGKRYYAKWSKAKSIKTD